MPAPQNPVYPPPPYYMQPRRTRWWIPLTIIGIVVIAILALILSIMGIVGTVLKKEPPVVKANSVLYLNLGKMISEAPSSSPFSFIDEGAKSTFFDVVRAIRDAKLDPKIKGIYYKATGCAMGFAKTKELLEALDDFKKSGKFIYAYIETGNENDYIKALPADKIFMPLEGMMEMNGFGISGMFLKGLFDKIGVDFYVQQFEDYKSAGETFSRRKFSDSARKNLRVIIDQRFKVFVDYIAKYRKMEPKKIIAALSRGVYSADSLMALGFIDEAKSEQDVKEFLKQKVFGKTKADSSELTMKLVQIDNYVKSDRSEIIKQTIDTKNLVAIIYASGTIVSVGQENPFASENMIVSSKYVKMIKEARENKKVKAIVLRIDSPGGSVIASDDIYNEIVKTKKVKPVYASMSDVAASGGYYIAMACDTIVAEPMTITGSIGVISMIPNFSGLMKKLDITMDTLSTGPAAQDLNAFYSYSQQQRNKLAGMMEKTYRRFVDKVAKARHKTFDETRALAKGRVWSGEDAQKIGLVDVLGGLQTTINIAKKRIGIPENTKVAIKEYPKKDDQLAFIKKILNMIDDEEESVEAKNLLKMNSNSTLMDIYQALPFDLQRQFIYLRTLMNVSQKEQVMFASPLNFEIR